MVAFDRRRKRLRVRRRGDAVGRDRRGEGMREVDVRAGVAGPSAAARLAGEAPSAFQPTCGIFRRCAASPCSSRQRPASTPRPGTSGASSLPSNSHCMPTQMPSSGVPASTARPIASRHGAPSAVGGGEMADAGHDQAGGARAVAGRLGHRELGAERGQRLLDRRQVAGAVVDQRDHSRPFVLGSIFASRASFAQATRSARANALNTASTW